jgi:hypothetical protein
MYMQSSPLVPELFTAHVNMSDTINHNIAQSEIEGGVYLRDLSEGEAIEIETENRLYTLVPCGSREALLCGHPEFCPRPVRVVIHGSTWGGTMLKEAFIGRGMHLEFSHPAYPRPITTSRIVEIRASQQLAAAA